MVTLPFAEFPFFSQDVLLDGQGYRFQFLWNTRSSSWTLSLYDQQDNPLVEGIPVALDQELLGQYHAEAVPPGELWAVDATDLLQTIGRDDLASGAVALVYVPLAEVPL